MKNRYYGKQPTPNLNCNNKQPTPTLNCRIRTGTHRTFGIRIECHTTKKSDFDHFFTKWSLCTSTCKTRLHVYNINVILKPYICKCVFLPGSIMIQFLVSISSPQRPSTREMPSVACRPSGTLSPTKSLTRLDFPVANWPVTMQRMSNDW